MRHSLKRCTLLIVQAVEKIFYADFQSYDEVPVFYFNVDGIIETVKRYNENTPHNHFILFPVKTLPLDVLMSALSPLVFGFDVSSEQEYLKIEKYSPCWVSCSSPILISALEGKVIHDLNSLDQFPLNNFQLRVNLDGDSRFGIPVDEIQQEVVSQAKGAHFHNQNWSAESSPFLRITQVIDSFIKRFNPSERFYFNIGGGFDSMGEDKFLNDLSSLCAHYPQYDFYTEMGRGIIKDHSYLFGKVLEVQNISTHKLSRIITNISRISHLRWELVQSQIKFFPQNYSDKRSLYQDKIIVGNTVSEADRLFRIRSQRDIYVQDIFSVDKIGGYGSVWNHAFGGAKLARTRYFLNDRISEV